MAPVTRDEVLAPMQRLHVAPVRLSPVDVALLDEAWRVADRCGLVRLYDAAYVALAIRHRARLVTLDGGLRNGAAARLAPIVGPAGLV
jgi:predicted nucleic acid-binding protein